MMVCLVVVAAIIVEVVRTPYPINAVVTSGVILKERRAIIATADASRIVDIGRVATVGVAVIIDGIIVVIVAVVVATGEAAQ